MDANGSKVVGFTGVDEGFIIDQGVSFFEMGRRSHTVPFRGIAGRVRGGDDLFGCSGIDCRSE